MSTHSLTFPATRAEALRRLDAFLPSAARAYAEGRNADHGPDKRENVSVLSPYLRHRMLTEEEVIAAVLARHSQAASEKYVQEVMWRTYWKGWLELRPAIWDRYVEDRDADLARAEHSGGLRKQLAAAEGGETGIEGFDDWARELVANGYLHNHARMWFASIWIFTLKLPWTLGADFFLRHLIDGDPASNTLSWRWVAGLQTAGKTYLATRDNIARYTGGRFEPQGLATHAAPLSEPPIPPPATLTSVADRRPEGAALLLVTSEDMVPESLFTDRTGIAGALVIEDAEPVRQVADGERSAAFKREAAKDAAARVGAAFGVSVDTIPILDAAAIIALAQATDATHVATAYAPVGPTATALKALRPELASARLPLVRVRRGWDDRYWPYATKGYFGFKQKLPDFAKGVS